MSDELGLTTVSCRGVAWSLCCHLVLTSRRSVLCCRLPSDVATSHLPLPYSRLYSATESIPDQTFALLRLSYQWRIQEEMVGGFFPFAALPSLPQNGPLKRCKLPVRVRAEPVRQMLLSILVQKSLLGVTVSSKQIKEASDWRYFSPETNRCMLDEEDASPHPPSGSATGSHRKNGVTCTDYHTKPSIPDCTAREWRDPQEVQNCAGLTTSLQTSANLVSAQHRASNARSSKPTTMDDRDVGPIVHTRLSERATSALR